jgi:hypothetical protein
MNDHHEQGLGKQQMREGSVDCQGRSAFTVGEIDIITIPTRKSWLISPFISSHGRAAVVSVRATFLCTRFPLTQHYLGFDRSGVFVTNS